MMRPRFTLLDLLAVMACVSIAAGTIHLLTLYGSTLPGAYLNYDERAFGIICVACVLITLIAWRRGWLDRIGFFPRRDS